MTQRSNEAEIIEHSIRDRCAGIQDMSDEFLRSRHRWGFIPCVWRHAARKAADELLNLIPSHAEELGFDYFDSEYEIRIVKHYNAEIDRRIELEKAIS